MRKALIFLYFISFFALSSGSFARIANSKMLYAIITPMPIEGKYIREQIKNPHFITIDRIRYLRGTINNREVVSAISGYGKVNVITVASRLIAIFHPKAIILAESSGAIDSNLKIGDVIIGSKLFDADFGELTKHGVVLEDLIPNPINHRVEPMIYYPNKHLKQIANKVASNTKFNFKVKVGTIVGSDLLPNPPQQIKLLLANKVEAIAMDGPPVAKLCWIFNTPCLALYGIANIAGVDIKEQGTAIAANHIGKVVVDIVKELPKN